MSDELVRLIPENSANCLGLKATTLQEQRGFFKSRLSPWISRSGMTPRLDIKRAAYLAIYHDYNAGNTEHSEHLQTILTALSNGDDNPLGALTHQIRDTLTQIYKSVDDLQKNLEAEDKRQYAEFHNTLEDAQRNHGVLWVGGDRNKNLADILTCFTYLYGTKPQDNPLMHNYGGTAHETAQDLLFSDLRKADPTVDIDSPFNRRRAVERYMKRISNAINRIINMSAQELEQTFTDDNVKHKAIVRKLKAAFNRLAVQVDYRARYKNIPDQFKDKSENYQLVALKPGKEYYQSLEGKFSWRTKKNIFLVLAIFFAVIVSFGQAAIAVFGLASVTAMVIIGISAFVTNALLFFRDIKSMLISVFSRRIFNGMSGAVKGFVWAFFVCSVVTGIVCGALAFVALLAAFGVTVVSAASWSLTIFAAVVAGVTIVGMTALLFMSGVSLAKALRAKTFWGICTDALKSVKTFFDVPEFNRSLVNLIKQRRTLLNGLSEDPESASKISALSGQIGVAKAAHYFRWGTKIVFSFLLMLFAIIASVVATVAFSIISAKGAADCFQALLHLSEKASNIAAKVLTWIPALIVNGTLSMKNLVNAAGFIADKVSKALSGGVYVIGIISSLAWHGHLYKAIKGSIQAIRNNPFKVIVPGIRTAISAVLCVLVALNGYGNGEAARLGGTVFDPLLPAFLPNWITGNPGTFAAICGTSQSIALNLMATSATSTADTPIQSLDKEAKPPVLGDVNDEELKPWRSARSVKNGQGFFGHLPKLQLKTGLTGANESVSLLGGEDIVDDLSTNTLTLEVYEETIDDDLTTSYVQLK